MDKFLSNLYEKNEASQDELLYILDNMNETYKEKLFNYAHETSKKYYDNKVYMRGLIEFSNYCKQDCMYCGIRASNKVAHRYRLSHDQIIQCCEIGYNLGYRTFVLQSGEDFYYDTKKLCTLIKDIKSKYADAAITLSLGERDYDTYKALYEAGADRYLLRHEAASEDLYNRFHPGMKLSNRIECLYNLKEIGFQVGAGFMVGLPHQTNEDLVEDLLFLKRLNPHMIGIGPYLPHKDTPLKEEKSGTLEKTLIMLALTRLLIPDCLLPSTTAVGTIHSKGREQALQAGANVVMPNLSPTNVRELYSLYDNKICTGDEAAHCRVCIQKRIQSVGFEVNMGRGDSVRL
ncbi:MAG: [FeFe] hydrogenase H-cluster radical SAM maturase HydE [Anaeromicrobium sp.]|jgi:biotin synthase|uniref:[FeFe] hydrogenase H-cluster radical SAM maturase HydE n=1 Tax=Anaeromicrobium sp. TaxID=1929132 RepID=UPI0025D1DDA7|nr:[FeFe] hydrogenase H-cluster radical SAM maturase HydE [Anaeromicrobium sp.]MCT4593808.1 [FeFe] hydrogenase H-cluster radical SAM maturase HydE [Anaeromicrobium sp.]